MLSVNACDRSMMCPLEYPTEWSKVHAEGCAFNPMHPDSNFSETQGWKPGSRKVNWSFSIECHKDRLFSPKIPQNVFCSRGQELILVCVFSQRIKYRNGPTEEQHLFAGSAWWCLCPIQPLIPSKSTDIEEEKVRMAQWHFSEPFA